MKFYCIPEYYVTKGSFILSLLHPIFILQVLHYLDTSPMFIFSSDCPNLRNRPKFTESDVAISIYDKVQGLRVALIDEIFCYLDGSRIKSYLNLPRALETADDPAGAVHIIGYDHFAIPPGDTGLR